MGLVLVVATATCRPTPASQPVSGARAAPRAAHLEAVEASALCVVSGRVAPLGDRRFHIDAGGVRAYVAGDHSATAELAFTYLGPSASVAPLANGELRRQIGLKLRAQDTCNVVYVMWHIEPSPGVFVSIKRNAAATTHAQCGAGGYINVQPDLRAAPQAIVRDVAHVLRADLDGEELRVTADGVVVWRGRLPAAAFAFDGPAGLRTDNGAFDLDLRVGGGTGGDPSGRSLVPVRCK